MHTETCSGGEGGRSDHDCGRTNEHPASNHSTDGGQPGGDSCGAEAGNGPETADSGDGCTSTGCGTGSGGPASRPSCRALSVGQARMVLQGDIDSGDAQRCGTGAQNAQARHGPSPYDTAGRRETRHDAGPTYPGH
jgi:hypothetical protein